MHPSISVIVPVYQAEKYLRRCVDSLLAQTFTDFEVLLIDDGSPDKSGEICDGYAARDSRVRVFHKENGGVSSARQLGIDNAQGEYTIHADPDDWVEPTMLDELYKKAKEEDSDMVICDFYKNTKYKQFYVKQQPSSLDSTIVQRELFQQLHGSCCNKLVRRACYKVHDVRFPEKLDYCEDLVFNSRLLAQNIKVSYLPCAYYHYSQDINPHSAIKHHKVDCDLQLMKILSKSLPCEILNFYIPFVAYNTCVRILRFGVVPRRVFRREHRVVINQAWHSTRGKMVYRIAFFLWWLI